MDDFYLLRLSDFLGGFSIEKKKKGINLFLEKEKQEKKYRGNIFIQYFFKKEKKKN